MITGPICFHLLLTDTTGSILKYPWRYFSILSRLGGTPPTPKKAGKLKTAISRPFLVQMSWFFAWDFVITYSVGKISHQPPDQPPAQPPVRAATRPTAFRQKLSNPADIRRDGYQAYNSASYEILAQTKPKWPTESPPKWIYCVLGPISQPFELCWG